MFRIQIIIRIAHTAFIMTWPLYTVFKNVQGGIYSTTSIVRECRRRSTELTDAKIGPTAREVMLSLEKPALGRLMLATSLSPNSHTTLLVSLYLLFKG